MTNKDGQADSMTVSELIASFRPKQLWILVVIAFGLLSGSFGLGYKASSYLSEAKISTSESEFATVKMSYEGEIATLKAKANEFRGLQTKQRFLEFYIKYLLALKDYEKSQTNQDREVMTTIAGNFKNYIMELVQRGEDAKDEIDLRGLYLSKGSGREAFVKFGYDGSRWVLPEEFGFHALE